MNLSDWENFSNEEYNNIIISHCNYTRTLLHKTATGVNRIRKIGVLTAGEYDTAINRINGIYEKLNTLLDSHIKGELSRKVSAETYRECRVGLVNIINNFGTENVIDVISQCCNNNLVQDIKDKCDLMYKNKLDLINDNSIPIFFKKVSWENNMFPPIISPNSIDRNKSFFDSPIPSIDPLKCQDMARDSRDFITRVNGMNMCIHNHNAKYSLIIACVFENSETRFSTNEFLSKKIKDIFDNKPDILSNDIAFEKFVRCLSIKQLCIHSIDEIYKIFFGYINQCNLIKQKPLTQVVKEFTNSEAYNQRLTLIQLLLKHNEPEYCHIAYLLYDLLSQESNGKIDNTYQNMIYESLPYEIKSCFKRAMMTTIDYTQRLVNSDNVKVPLDKRICLMKASDSVKEKAMEKFKEVKSRSEETGMKAKNYLDGLLKIPFGIFKEEPILKVVKDCVGDFNILLSEFNLHEKYNIVKKERYSTLEMNKYLPQIKDSIDNILNLNIPKYLEDYFNSLYKYKLVTIGDITNLFNKKYKIEYKHLNMNYTKKVYVKELLAYFDYLTSSYPESDLIMKYIATLNCPSSPHVESYELLKEIKMIENKWSTVQKGIQDMKSVLDDAVYGHDDAKRQIERIVGQWMSGEQQGYCFGFEGPPGVGKTSIAKKGLAKCLVDENNKPRPFGFVAVGGSSNGSTLEGHNYTYVGSSWGQIVEILMNSKCMNPIIFIDELDKISRTEHGKEMIGILTHLVDRTQNDSFNDKYFKGIDIDLSKALFIFSYNDASKIDRILLDRIHRIKFDNLSVEEKIIVVNKHILPEYFEQMNLIDMIKIDNDVIRYIIEQYTLEAGVRKLKEILFEIISEINLELLDKNNIDIHKEIPIILTIDMIKNTYLKKRNPITEKKINSDSKVGIINGLWANAYGRGGIIPIEANYFPTNTFLDMKLTGMQGDVMKESMNVAKTLAYRMTNDDRKKYLLSIFNDTKMQGLHIHCPEGAVPKDGPSAGTAITITLFSLFNNFKIKNNIAITGEINLQGFVTAIGGLDLKILGGIKAGVTEFIFPKSNSDDFDKFMDKYGSIPSVDNISFHMVEHIDEVIEMVFV